MQMLKVFALMAGLTLIMVGAGSYFGGSQGAVAMFVVAALMNLGSYWFSDRMVLRMYRAQIVDRTKAPELYAMVERLARRAQLPMPVVAIAPSDQPNAFATGRSPEKGVVCFTQGILRVMPVGSPELEGVTAHELAHIKHRHILVGAIAATMAGMIMMLSRVGMFFGGGGRDRDRGGHPIVAIAMMILAPIAAMLVQLAISRQNEYQADRTGAEIAGNPRGLANALRKMDALAHQIPMEINPAAAALAIVNPLTGRRGLGFGGLFTTHPSTEERVARLEALAR
ncbi:MAG: protease HtpX [Gemmatimonadetes bacterium]|nr:protease HtpX [Gemmatimonadota bacterium]